MPFVAQRFAASLLITTNEIERPATEEVDTSPVGYGTVRAKRVPRAAQQPFQLVRCRRESPIRVVGVGPLNLGMNERFSHLPASQVLKEVFVDLDQRDGRLRLHADAVVDHQASEPATVNQLNSCVDPLCFGTSPTCE